MPLILIETQCNHWSKPCFGISTVFKLNHEATIAIKKSGDVSPITFYNFCSTSHGIILKINGPQAS